MENHKKQKEMKLANAWLAWNCSEEKKDGNKQDKHVASNDRVKMFLLK